MADQGEQRAVPWMIYDGDCAFCRRWIARWKAATGDRIEYAPYQTVAQQFPAIPIEAFKRAVQLVEPDGTVFSGANAVFRALAHGAKKRWPLWLYRHVPGVRSATESAYRFVANHRRGLTRITGWLWGPPVGPPSYLLTRSLFVRAIGVIYLIAFVSLGVQIHGLVGHNGILPAGEFLDRVVARFGDEAWWRFPTLAWYSSSDRFLQGLCWGGAAAAALAVLRIAPAVMLALCWVFYLSLFYVGQRFLSFQWDILLLETGLLAVFYAAWSLRPRLTTDRKPSTVVRWLIILLLFRLMFSSGIVKLLDDSPTNPTWHHLTALTFHYLTTCIPTRLSWYADKLPLWFQTFSCAVMFAIEVGVPFLFFFPRRLRLLAFWLEVMLQVLIMLTGNYNFFNLLTLVLCLPLVDDAFLGRFLPRARSVSGDAARRRKAMLFQRLCIVTVAVPILLLNVIQMKITLREDRRSPGIEYNKLPAPVQELVQLNARYHFVSRYGLFRQMTTRRDEIVVEGSNDRETWQPYEFKWKPGDVRRPPFQVAPHQPRLDWQMWFAALGNYRQPRNQWFILFLRRLLEGSPDVLALLDNNPFSGEPPRFVRAVLYEYHLSDWDTRRRDGAWWTRERIGPYTPVVSLDSFRHR